MRTTRFIRGTLLAALIASWLPSRAEAEVTVPSIISDGMVLQHGRGVRIWGWADAGEKVTVTLEGKDQAAVAGADRRWRVELPSHAPGGPVQITVAGAKNTITLKDVLFGEVWLGSGQSNMAWGVSGSATPEEIASFDYPMIRSFQMHLIPTEKTQTNCLGGWRSANPKTVGDFSAASFWFALNVYRELKIPIGLINSSRGATWGEAWTQREALENDPDFQPMFDRQKKFMAEFPKVKLEMEAALEKWRIAAEVARNDKHAVPPKPSDPRELYGYRFQNFPGHMYNTGIAPIMGYTMRGALWYQGEGNTERAYQYRKLLPMMINNWRTGWGQGDFHFLIVQLPNYSEPRRDPGDSNWAELRETQQIVAKTTKNCGMAVTIDLGDPKDVHPKNKWDIGKRLALVALAQIYDKKIEYSGPALDKVTLEGNKATLTFNHADGGLAAGIKGDDGMLRGFAVAGEDRKFYWADARMDGSTVTVSCPKVEKIAAVRYAWANNPVCNMYNKVGLPAAPFRTDDWPGVTRNNK